MNIFIGFGYNNDDKWVKDLVFPLVEAFDATITTGEDMHGEVLSQGVTDRIKKADGVLTFLTRRDALASGKYTSHRWVFDELSTSIANKIPAVEIRERMVDAQGGLPGDRQRVEFDLDDKAKLLVELAKLLSAWRRNLKPRRLFLQPMEVVKDVRQMIHSDELKCMYQFMHGSKESPVYTAKPFKFGQGLCVDIYQVPSEDALVQIIIKGKEFEWSSDYESVQLLSINLQRN